jgi:integrase/recombinase XerD
MLTSFFPRTHTHYSSLPVLGGLLEPLCTWLQGRGFPPNAIRRRMVVAPFLDQFFRRRQIRSLRECTAARLRSCLPREDRWTPQIAYALGRSLIAYLKDRGELSSTPLRPSEQLVASYRQYLGQVRGLSASSVCRHAALAGDFLRAVGYDDRPNHLMDRRVAEIDAFITKAAARVGRITMVTTVGILRSFLRFVAASGQSPLGLDRHIDSPRLYRHGRLVRALPWETVQLLLRTIDRSTRKGCRDYAMLLLIATYGLRVSEVAGLDLDDIGWRARMIHVPRPKVGSPLAVPLTDEVASALRDYLRHRSPTPHRRVFLRVRAPEGPIEPTAVTDVFDVWAARAGIRVPAIGGPHCLRHSLAMHLLRQGATLKTIGDLLGHRSLESTGIYLRLQIEDLRDVALSLPTTVAPLPEVQS